MTETDDTPAQISVALEGYELFQVPAGTVIETGENGAFYLKYPDGSTRYVSVGYRPDGGIQVTQTIVDKDCEYTLTVKPPSAP